MIQHLDPIIALVAGAVLLLAGRQLFWLFVAAIGFVLGSQVAPVFLPAGSENLALFAGIGCGVAGALFAIFVQKAAITLAGFLAGGMLCAHLASLLFGEAGAALWIAFIVGGVAGAIFMVVIFKWTLVVLSSMAGAALVAKAAAPREELEIAIFVALTFLGLLMQSRALLRR